MSDYEAVQRQPSIFSEFENVLKNRQTETLLLNFIMYIMFSLLVCLCTTCMSDGPRGPEKEARSLELELQVVVRCLWVLGTKLSPLEELLSTTKPPLQTKKKILPTYISRLYWVRYLIFGAALFPKL